MHLFIKLVLMVLRIVRDVFDWFLEEVFSWFYEGKHEKLPPIINELIIEPAHVLAAKIRLREVSSVDVVKAYIERIRQIQPIVNAVVDERFTEALEEARFVDELLLETQKNEDEIEKDTPLLGVPFSVKEAIAVKGCLFTVGLPARRGLRATSDSDAVAQLKKAGGIPIAMTITPELCYWWESYNTLYGRCRNPYNTSRTSGGSSGGEGCILGSAGSVIGIGNDIGGSIRIPASFNGVFGHKPSRGAVSNVGQFPTTALALQTYLMTGPMCRYASDLKPLMKILATDYNCIQKLDEKVNFEDLKIYYMEDEGGNPLVSTVNPEIIMAQRKVLQHFKDTYGITAEKVQIKHMFRCFEMWSKIISSSDMNLVAFEMTGRNGKADLLVESFKWLIGASDHILPVLFMAIMDKIWKPDDQKKCSKQYSRMLEIEAQVEQLLGSRGVLICPTNPDFAPYHHQALFKSFNMSYTAIFNLLGLPVSQCPVTMSGCGMPIGLQVVSGMHNDHVTIAIAEELERVFGGWVSPSSIACEKH